MEYQYPDPQDRATLAFERAHEPYPGYCQLAEDFALRRAERLLGDTSAMQLLDFGCGMGRLIPRLAASFGHIMAIDPDRSRLDEAQSLVVRKGLAHVECLCGGIDNVEASGKRFDVALCSHVMQHVTRRDGRRIIEGLHRVLRHDGILVLLTSLSHGPEEAFCRCRMTDTGTVVEPTDAPLFDTSINDKAGLPVRLFTLETARRLVAGCFEVLLVLSYQSLGSCRFIDRWILRDRLYSMRTLAAAKPSNVMLVASRRGLRTHRHGS
jgi:ubiquinone/menaquinone biosynthesis C-methylase UbiE